MGNKKLIIFDLDGTLIDSVPDLAEAVNKMLLALGLSAYDEDTIRNWVGNGAQILVKRALLGTKELDKSIESGYFNKALKLFLDFYVQNVCVKTRPYPNVITTLRILKEKGFILAIVTNKPAAFVSPILQTLGLETLFTYTVGGDSLERKKPDPLPLLHVCKELNFSIEESVMVGDSKNDIVAASSASMDSIAVTYGYNYGESIQSYHPDVVVDDVKEIVDILV